MSLRERIAFLGQLRRNFEQTGAVQPSSRHLAAAMVLPLRRYHAEPRRSATRILEIGPGTGAVTRAIADCMAAGDELDAYEVNARFVHYLAELVREDPRLARLADRIRVHHAAAQHLDDVARFDFAVCSAPLNNFDADTIDQILGRTLAALKPGGTLTMFEYAVFPALRRAVGPGESRRRLRAAQEAKAGWLARHGRDSRLVLRNLPPARVHELVRPGREVTPPAQA